MNKIAIIRESRTDDSRTPLIPTHIKELSSKFPDISITVQPSKHRCFSDQEYEEQGAIISEDLSDCDLILGVKEIEPDLLTPSKSYMFFSHTRKSNLIIPLLHKERLEWIKKNCLEKY